MNKFKTLVATALIASLATSNIVVAMDSGNTDEKDWSDNWEGHPPVNPPQYAQPVATALNHDQELQPMDAACNCGHAHDLAEDAQASQIENAVAPVKPNQMMALLVTKVILGAVIFSALSTLAIKNIDALAKKLPFKPKHKESKDALKKILGSTVAFSLLGAVGSYLINKYAIKSKTIDNTILRVTHLSAPAA